MTNIEDFHHYKGNNLTPAEQVERKFAELLINSDLPDSDRESSIIWELKHSSGCCQIARILAQKRGLDIEIAEVSALLHDIYVVVEGKYSNHAALGAPIAQKLLEEAGGFTSKQIETIVKAIAHHSQKEIYSDDPYVELVKDVDVFDCSLYRGSGNYYKLHKPAEIVEEYTKRTDAVRNELGLPKGDIFRNE
ncbi:MAG: HD domain-containing protein [Candidatus Saccharimonadales bacterium]